VLLVGFIKLHIIIIIIAAFVLLLVICTANTIDL
jgi:hypothetical protein